MKKIFLSAILCITCFFSQAQSRAEKEVSLVVEALRIAIINADEKLLKSLLSDNLVYVHSNASAQSKKDFVEELVRPDPLDYTSAEISKQTISISGRTAVVRHYFAAKTLSKGVSGNINVGVMQVWQKRSGKWRLLARQGYKLP
jgi:hypothetical protein